MTQKERIEKSRSLIINAALNEFSAFGYKGTNIEKICKKYDISKGMMYHYFRGKDDLYLECVKIVMDSLYRYLDENKLTDENIDPYDEILEFYKLREKFFQNKMRERAIFEEALLHPEESLKESIDDLRKPIKKLNRTYFKTVLSKLELREGVSKDMAERYLSTLSSSFSTLLSYYAEKEDKLEGVFHSIEDLISMLIFGMANT